MNELYWITVLGNLNSASGIALIIGTIILIVLIMIFFAAVDTWPVQDELKDDAGFKALCKGIKWTIFLLMIFIGVKIFVPSTPKLYMIYGLGGTIDYLQKNETANKLPDKVMIALDKWIDNLNVTKDAKENEDE